MRIVALDLSLSCTGLADETGTRTIRTDLRGAARLDYIGRMVMDEIVGPFADVEFDPFVRPNLVAIEGPSYASAHQAHHLGELGGVVRRDLFVCGVPYVEVSPRTVKVYATNNGNCSKTAMILAAAKRLGYEGESDDEADAAWLYALVKAAVGEPVVELPKTHERAVDTVRKLLPERTLT